jgi:choline dehydrogenase-like flavoprotein
VLLLEAGPDRRADMPAELRNGWTIEREEFDWGYVGQRPARDPVPVRRKRVLGGTSWLTRFTPRGSPADYDGWEALGNPGWRFDEVLPYFIRLEADADFGGEAWHGDRGPLPSSVTSVMMQAACTPLRARPRESPFASPSRSPYQGPPQQPHSHTHARLPTAPRSFARSSTA